MLTAFPQDAFNEALEDSTTQQLPAGARFMFHNFRLLVALMLLVLATTLVAAIGLLRRHNWARILFMVILGFGVLYSLGGMVLQQNMMPDFSHLTPADSTATDATRRLGTMFRVFQAVMMLMSLGFAALFTWLIWKLASPGVRGEFAPPPGAA
jgi:cytochrome bd-type quinol oxidase subunit 2